MRISLIRRPASNPAWHGVNLESRYQHMGPPHSCTFRSADAAGRLGIRPASLYSYVSRGPCAPSRRRTTPASASMRPTTWRRWSSAASVSAVPRLRPRPRSIGVCRARDEHHADRGRTALLSRTGCRGARRRGKLRRGRRAPHRPAAEARSALRSLARRQLGEMSDFLGRAVGLLATMRGDASDPAAILRVMAFAGSGTRPEFLQHHLARAWGLGEPGQDAIRRALVLFADHELSTSAFAVRVVASTGARLAEAVIAGLAAERPRHGGATERVRALFEAARLEARRARRRDAARRLPDRLPAPALPERRSACASAHRSAAPTRGRRPYPR